ncbi:protoheme IX farnesyltransferase [Planctomycetales bacterium ZRK34]|nr:protoheme IX farnesyltransferase [Planctomycetales bacterium ZRK34]
MSMNPSMSHAVATESSPLGAVRQLWSDYMTLAKIRLTGLVMATAAVGFVLGSGDRIAWPAMFYMLIGTLLASAAASAFNQVAEIQRDARMPRTRNRPLPAGRVGSLHAIVYGIVCTGLGLTIQAAAVNLLSAAMTALTIFVYVAVYTPLKSRSTVNTLVGAVVGALPPMMGYVAAAGSLGPGAWVLGAVLFIWQVPHFLALAWLYRRDYELGGYRMLPSVDPSGAITGRMIVVWSIALVPMGLVGLQVGVTGYVFAFGAIALGAWLVWLGITVHRKRTDGSARRMFLATLAYLPLLMGLMVFDRIPLWLMG